MKFESAVKTCQRELAALLDRRFPLDDETRTAWTTPERLTELSLGVDQWPFLVVECGERTGALVPTRFSIGPLAESFGIKPEPKLSDPELVSSDLEIEDESDETYDAIADANRALTCVVHGLVLADFVARASAFKIEVARDLACFLYRDLDDPSWDAGTFRVEDEAFFAAYTKAACDDARVADFILDVVSRDVPQGMDAARWIEDRLDAHPGVRALVLAPSP